LAEWKVRDQVIDALRFHVASMEKTLLEPTQAPRGSLSPEQVALQKQLAQLLKLQADGVPGLEASIADLSLRLMPPDVAAPIDWSGFAEVITAPGVLEASSDEDLRVVLLELVEEVLYTGSPDRVHVALRDAVGGDSEEG
jgi:hypothetical protein